jgi:putative transposase
MNTSRNMTSLPNTEDASLSRASAQELSALLAKMPQADRAQVRLDGHDLILPRQALTLLRDVLSQMAQGNAATIVPTHAELTTQEAANILTVVTHHRVPVFTNEEHVEVLRQAFRKIMAARPFTIDALVVLPEHRHCIWRMPEDDADYSSRWREIKKAASRRIRTITNIRKERMLWQRRFWEHAIRDGEDWRRHVDYIHYNPVKHGLVDHPGDWRWSSFRHAVKRGWYERSWGASEPEHIAAMDCE